MLRYPRRIDIGYLYEKSPYADQLITQSVDEVYNQWFGKKLPYPNKKSKVNKDILKLRTEWKQRIDKLEKEAEKFLYKYQELEEKEEDPNLDDIEKLDVTEKLQDMEKEYIDKYGNPLDKAYEGYYKTLSNEELRGYLNNLRDTYQISVDYDHFFQELEEHWFDNDFKFINEMAFKKDVDVNKEVNKLHNSDAYKTATQVEKDNMNKILFNEIVKKSKLPIKNLRRLSYDFIRKNLWRIEPSREAEGATDIMYGLANLWTKAMRGQRYKRAVYDKIIPFRRAVSAAYRAAGFDKNTILRNEEIWARTYLDDDTYNNVYKDMPERFKLKMSKIFMDDMDGRNAFLDKYVELKEANQLDKFPRYFRWGPGKNQVKDLLVNYESDDDIDADPDFVAPETDDDNPQVEEEEEEEALEPSNGKNLEDEDENVAFVNNDLRNRFHRELERLQNDMLPPGAEGTPSTNAVQAATQATQAAVQAAETLTGVSRGSHYRYVDLDGTTKSINFTKYSKLDLKKMIDKIRIAIGTKDKTNSIYKQKLNKRELIKIYKAENEERLKRKIDISSSSSSEETVPDYSEMSSDAPTENVRAMPAPPPVPAPRPPQPVAPPAAITQVQTQMLPPGAQGPPTENARTIPTPVQPQRDLVIIKTGLKVPRPPDPVVPPKSYPYTYVDINGTPKTVDLGKVSIDGLKNMINVLTSKLGKNTLTEQDRISRTDLYQMFKTENEEYIKYYNKRQ